MTGTRDFEHEKSERSVKRALRGTSMRAGSVRSILLRLAAGAAIVFTMTPLACAAPGEDKPTPWTEWRTLARAPASGDTVIVRGSFVHRDPADGDPTFVSYRIEGGDGRLWISDSLPGFEHGLDVGGCDLSCRVATRDSGFAVILEAGCWPSYPDVYPSYQYVVSSGGGVARSDWTDVEWSPEQGDTAQVWVEDGCAAYLIPLAAQVGPGIMTFVVRLPKGIRESEEFSVPAGTAHCYVPSEADTVRTVEIFTSADSKEPVPMKFRPGPSGALIEVRSAFVRVRGTNPATLSVGARLIEVLLDGRRVFIAPGGLEQLGYQQP